MEVDTCGCAAQDMKYELMTWTGLCVFGRGRVSTRSPADRLRRRRSRGRRGWSPGPAAAQPPSSWPWRRASAGGLTGWRWCGEPGPARRAAPPPAPPPPRPVAPSQSRKTLHCRLAGLFVFPMQGILYQRGRGADLVVAVYLGARLLGGLRPLRRHRSHLLPPRRQEGLPAQHQQSPRRDA